MYLFAQAVHSLVFHLEMIQWADGLAIFDLFSIFDPYVGCGRATRHHHPYEKPSSPFRSCELEHVSEFSEHTHLTIPLHVEENQ
jgi:hypothetical protein